MKHNHLSVFSFLRFAVAGALVLAAVALTVTATKISAPLQTEKLAYTPKKVDADSFYKGRNAETAIVAEAKNPDSSPEVESYLLRAYPESEVSGDATLAAMAGWSALNSNAHSAGSWQLIGPSKATYPTQLTPFLFDGAQYIASGRVTGLAIGSTCKPNNCLAYVAAAGGGIWKASDVSSSSQPVWKFISGNFPAPTFAPGVSTSAINAIGSILLDPKDPTNNTLYVGTGEPNASGDSEAGVGIYKTTDGGQSWTVVPDSAKFFQRAIGQMDFDNAGNLLVTVASSVRGVSSVTSGASSSAATGHPLITRGVYRCDLVSTCTLLRATFIRGATTVKMDPTHPGVMYATFFNEGVWRSTDNGATWSQIAAPRQGAVIERDEFAINTLPNGNTRMYVGKGTSSDTDAVTPSCPTGNCRAHLFKTDDASGAAVFTDITTPQDIGYCTGQCWYDNVVYTPAGYPDIVYLGGSFSYGQVHAQSNGRAWLQSLDGGTTFADITQDSNKSKANGHHPDQHAIITLPGKPLQFITGSDGGLVANDAKAYVDVSYKCDSRGLNAADTAYCKSLLNRVPNQLFDQNTFLSTLQFQSLSISSQSPLSLLQGGTQDNGTFQYNGSKVVWPQIIYGDGGQSGFMVTNDAVRFNTFTGQANDANFQNGDPTKWVIISAPILSSPEGAYFYPPIIADPNAAFAGSIFQGSFSVWRTQDWGGNQAYLEANCQEFTTSATQPGCGDFVIIGDGVPSTQLTSAAWGSRAGGAVAWLQRTASNTGTLWAATGTGRVFISDNANDPASAVHWYRLDLSAANDPGRAISAIAVDPANADHAFVAYNGYDVNTPTTPGHVFEVIRTPATSTAVWTNISYNLPDFPITALVRDDNTGDLYAGSDFGVMKLPFGTTTWVVAGSGLPAVEVAGLSINSGARVLYAATHGRSAWTMTLP
jgi:hypothetical protein